MTVHRYTDPFAPYARVFEADGSQTRGAFLAIDDEDGLAREHVVSPYGQHYSMLVRRPLTVEYWVPFEMREAPLCYPGFVYERFDLATMNAVWRRVLPGPC